MFARYDIHRNVHKGIRAELSRLLVRIAAMDPTDRYEKREVSEQCSSLALAVEAHHRRVDALVGPQLVRGAPELFARVEREHGAFLEELDALSRCASRLIEAEGEDAAALAEELHRDVSAFVARSFVQMDSEERVVADALKRLLGADELARIQRAVVVDLEPGACNKLFRIVFAAMNPVEREALLVAIRESEPPSAFARVCEQARTALSGSAWAKLEAKLFGKRIDGGRMEGTKLDGASARAVGKAVGLA